MKVLVHAFLICLAAGFSYAQAQDLSKQKPAKPTEAKQPAPNYERGTREIPVVIEIGPSTPLKIEAARDQDAENEKAANDKWIAWGTIAIAGFTFLLAVVTGGLAIFTFNLWKSTSKLVIGAEQTAERQLRAYVGCSEIALECPNLTNPSYVPVQTVAGLIFEDYVLLTIKNYGQTPASEVGTFVNWTSTMFATRLAIEFPYPDINSTTVGDLGPIPTHRTLFPTQVAIDKIAIPDLSVFRQAHQKQVFLYFYGHIKYRDIYNRTQDTNFCSIYEPWRPIGDQFVPVSQHNDAT